ncbi:hypothetical protein AJ80_04042 [Polytolypa hystricis UAMH7299]|uniref:Uncharacterized protein n=1 Tax=Polytolypa hystricis (strain UAMH7299) TaxID=1447883 RepID=A0A2B7YDY0_POLH7|nr:hypothetical protein AJ80_04042 [Polytolypa hystricis UAMH7299]
MPLPPVPSAEAITELSDHARDRLDEVSRYARSIHVTHRVSESRRGSQGECRLAFSGPDRHPAAKFVRSRVLVAANHWGLLCVASFHGPCHADRAGMGAVATFFGWLQSKKARGGCVSSEIDAAREGPLVTS